MPEMTDLAVYLLGYALVGAAVALGSAISAVVRRLDRDWDRAFVRELQAVSNPTSAADDP